MHRIHSWLAIVALGFAPWVSGQSPPTYTTPSGVGIAYDIVACRMPVPSTIPSEYRNWFPDIFNFSLFVGHGSDLVLIHPNGTETLLVDASAVPIRSAPGGTARTSANASIVDPCVSFDAKTIYFALFEDALQHPSSKPFSVKPSFIYKYSFITQAVTQLTFGDTIDVSNQSRASTVPWAKFDVAPVELADGRLLFLSTRANVMEPGNERPSPRFYRMHADGSNVEPLENFTLGSCQHPIILRDGRIVWTHFHPAGRRAENGNYVLLVANPDMSDIKTMAGDHYWNTGFHFAAQLSDTDLATTAYYQQNNMGHGVVVRFPLVTGQGFLPVSDSTDHANHYGVNDHFERVSQVLVNPWSLSQDSLSADTLAPLVNGSSVDRRGKCTMAAGVPGGHMLLVWSPGGVNARIAAETEFPHMTVAYAPSGVAAQWSDLRVLKSDPNYHYMYPKPLVTYQAIHGVARPTLIPDTANGGMHPALPAGAAFATTGTSSVYNRESRWPNSYDDPIAPNGNAHYIYRSTIWRVGQDTYRFPNSEIHAAQVVADMTHFWNPWSWSPPILSQLRSHNNGTQIWGILGEIPLRKLDSNGAPILDALGDPDTSYEVRIPADVPFHHKIIDRNGITLTSEWTWHSARPGERKTNCGGCHAHSTNTSPLSFASTQAGVPGYQVTDFALQTPMVSRDAQNNPSVVVHPQKFKVFEYWRDVQPVFTARCIGCHDGANPNTTLDLRENAPTPPWDVLAFTHTTSFPLASRDTQATKYVRKHAASQSLLVWKAYGARLDGRTDATRPGVNDDIDFGPAHAPTITFDEKRAIAAWVDLGCLVDVDRTTAGESDPFDDQMPPTLAISGIARGKVLAAPASITLSAFDLHSALNAASFEVRMGSWTATNLFPTGQTVTDGSVHVVPLPSLAKGQTHRIHVGIADAAGNRNRQIVEVTPLDPATLTVVGTGSPGTGGVTPDLDGNMLPRVGEEAFGLEILNALPNTFAAIWWAGGLANPPIQLTPNAFIYIDALNTFGSGFTDGSGVFRAGLPINNDPSLNGVTLHFQGIVFDPGGQVLIPGVTGALTNALTMTIGG